MEDTALQWLSERLGHPDNFTSVIFLPRPRPGAPLHEEVNLHSRRDERRGGTAAPGGAAAPPTPASCPSASSRGSRISSACPEVCSSELNHGRGCAVLTPASILPVPASILPAFLLPREAVAEWLVCRSCVHQVLDNVGSNSLLPPGIFQSLPSGIRLPTCCPEDHLSTPTLEELSK
ncbi:uncharacterized protein LOC126989854 isoform X3 [Eriocheir sinensis]|nr:uncharacterized protein LOC126989854 isoform X3 [Eriocheir sinensis]